MDKPSTCTVIGCERERIYRLYCHPHYRRWKRNGEPGPATVRTVAKGPQLCSFPTCERPRRTAQLCASHYLQKHQRRPLAPLVQRPDTLARDASGRKQCSSCGNWLAISDYYGNTSTKDGLATNCRRCHRSANLMRLYGISVDDYEQLLAAQGGGCAICGGQNDDGRQLFVDHDHSTGRVRGILCNRCNRAIGLLSDNPTRLSTAISYLQRSQHG